MQTLNKNLVSVVIPAYNCESFIKDTIDSILFQNYSNFEIILIDDGSTDGTGSIIRQYEDIRISYVYQSNQGVSKARNNGFNKAIGEYLVFFDSDDIMSKDFIKSKIDAFIEDESLDFVCGELFFFDKLPKNVLKKGKGIVKEIEEKVLFYKDGYASCPSNYMYKTNSILQNNIRYNSNLSSTADRYFLMEVSNRGLKGKLIKERGELFYRINPESMSNKMTYSLLQDNVLFYKELKENKMVSLPVKRRAFSKGYYILSGAAYNLKLKFYALNYALKSFFNSPIYFLSLLSKK